MSEFLTQLKVGDKVAMAVVHYFTRKFRVVHYRYGIVERITPKRTKIVVSGATLVDKRGSLSRTIVPISDETDKANAIYAMWVQIYSNKITISRIITDWVVSRTKGGGLTRHTRDNKKNIRATRFSNTQRIDM